MYHFNPKDEWNSIHDEDLWVYNKLFLSHRLKYLCGPVGCPVPSFGRYIVRPSINLLGMGRYSRLEWLRRSTDHLHPSEFWCEYFTGEHISVDFYQKRPVLTVKGERNLHNPFYKWQKWYKIDKEIEFPSILNELKGDYKWINCEFIGDKLIEVHFRQNPDFRYGNSVAIPVWKNEKIRKIDGLLFIKDEDYLRKGFYVDARDSNPVKSSDFTNQEQKND